MHYHKKMINTVDLQNIDSSNRVKYWAILKRKILMKSLVLGTTSKHQLRLPCYFIQEVEENGLNEFSY